MSDRVETELIVRAIAEGFDKLAEQNKRVGDEVEKIRDKTDKASKGLVAYESANEQAAGALRAFGVDLTSFNEPLTLVAEQLKASIDIAAEWGDSMGDLAQVTGGAVPEVSKMAASLELIGIQGGTLEMALKSMTKNGLQLNMDTLRRLSVEYQAIQDPVKQNEFLFKNFGRAGIEMAEAMGKSSDELDRLALAASRSGKVISDDAADAAEEFNLQMAILTQRAEGLQIKIGNALIPTLNDAATGFDNLWNTIEALNIRAQLSRGVITQQEAAMRAAALAGGELATSLEDEERAAMAADAANRALAISADAARWAALADAEAERQAAEAKYLNDGAARALSASFQELTAQMFFNQAAAGLDTESQIALARSLGLINEESYTTLSQLQELRARYDANRDGAISAAEGAARYAQEARNLASAINSIPTEHTTRLIIQRESYGGDFDVGMNDRNRRRAFGGSVTGGVPYTWNEPGMGGEVLVPAGNGYVLSRRDAMDALRGGGGNNADLAATLRLLPSTISRAVRDGMLQAMR